MLTITETAQDYLASLLAKQEEPGMNIRIFVEQPGTPQAESCIAYCKTGEQQADDLVVVYKGFNAYIDAQSLSYLEDGWIDYVADKMGGQLTIKAPNAKKPLVGPDSPLEERINYILYAEINPSLASHGGQVSLIEVVDSVAIMRFGGGCQGCGMANVTLKQGVEKTLLEKIPELTAVRDVTDHTERENAYYK